MSLRRHRDGPEMCRAPGCSKLERHLGLCVTHYSRMRRAGSLDLPPVGWNTGPRKPGWKGEDAGYVAKHAWVQRQLGKPSLCADCGTTDAKRYEWANISGEYKRDLDDWKRLCTRC